MAESQTQVQNQAQTQVPAQAPVAVVKERPFGTFSLLITLAIILALFLYVYLSQRRKKTVPKHVDQKAGDEGED